MPSARAFAVLGAHPARSQQPAADTSGDDPYLDAFDLVIELDDGARVVAGIRTFDYLQRPPAPEIWPGGYVPLAVTLDFTAVRHYDFDRLLWLGPDPRPCLVWSNALGLRRAAIAYLLDPCVGSSALLAGPDGDGLPSPDELGIAITDALRWYPAAAAVGSPT